MMGLKDLSEELADNINYTDAIVAPDAQMRGNIAIPCAILVESVNSPIMLLITPTLPFNSPAMHRLQKITQH
jgi:hypothetical protein